MRTKSELLIAGLLVAAFAGCETVERRVPGGKAEIKYVHEDPQADNRPLKQLEELTEKEPENPKAWALLADYHERHQDFERAALAYEQMNQLIERFMAKHPQNGPYTGGRYSLGKIYAKLGRYDLAINHLEAVKAMKPKDIKLAALNNHFHESHYLLGAIYHMHRQWRPAKLEFEAFLLLQGNNQLAHARVEPYLAEIRREID